MNIRSDVLNDAAVPSQRVRAAAIPPIQLFYWSVRREFWENRSLYLAPLMVAALVLPAVSVVTILGIWEPALRLNPAHPGAHYDIVAGLMMATGIIVSVFYCLDALHGERRDRSILFWKSLPVSDLITVLAKASIPLLILPLLVFAIAVALQWMMLLVSCAVLLVSGQGVATLWNNLSFGMRSLLLLYHMLTAHALWPAPVYCWLLLVSGWPRRATFLWAVLPLVVIAGIENLAFHTWHFGELVLSHFIGGAQTVVPTSPAMFPTDPMTHISPGTFLSTPGLWIGLLIAAIFLAAAVRLRRYQGPI